MAAILKNSSPTSAIKTCNKIGKCVILVGPIKARFAGKRVGSNTNTNQNGNKNNENITPKSVPNVKCTYSWILSKLLCML